MNQSISVANTRETSRRIISGSFLIAGTTVGAGMLGIPLVTAESGFVPAVAITLLAWFFMLATGLLLLEVSLWMPQGANLLTIAERFLGKKGRLIVAGLFLFLYTALLVAYFAAGAPLFLTALQALFGIPLQGWIGYFFFAAFFGVIVSLGAKWIDRTNLILTLAMIMAYGLMIGVGSSEVKGELLAFSHWPKVFVALPILFSAFGYHNVIPPLTSYLKRDRKALQLSLFFGTTLALLIYLLWQWLVIGSIPKEGILSILDRGFPATQAFGGKPFIFLIGQYFAFFAVTTSLLGVSFSMVDFVSEGLKCAKNRLVATFLTFFFPFLFVSIDPTLFECALGIAGGFGEAILNGLLPVALVWIGRYSHRLPSVSPLWGGKFSLGVLFVISLFVIFLEALALKS
jgi:tyrosine-specific transport protein